MTYTTKIHDAETGEIIEREMTKDEIAQHEKERIEVANELKREADAEKLKEVAQAKLAALGLTTDDLKALGL